MPRTKLLPPFFREFLAMVAGLSIAACSTQPPAEKGPPAGPHRSRPGHSAAQEAAATDRVRPTGELRPFPHDINGPKPHANIPGEFLHYNEAEVREGEIAPDFT